MLRHLLKKLSYSNFLSNVEMSLYDIFILLLM